MSASTNTGLAQKRTAAANVGRSRGGLTTKVHALVDGNGLPLRLALSAGQDHDGGLASNLLVGFGPKCVFLADRAYDSDVIRKFVRAQDAWANIPPKRNRRNAICFSSSLYRERNHIERFFSSIKHCRRIATRYDKLSKKYIAFVKLASVRLWLQIFESTP